MRPLKSFARIWFFTCLALALALTSVAFTVNATGVDRDKQPISPEKPPTPEEALQRFTTNLTEKAKQGKSYPFVGRSDLRRQVWEGLNKAGNKAIFITGEAGSGKSAIVESIAGNLDHKQVYLLNLMKLEGGTQYRGSLEDRVPPLLEAFTGHPERILFIDEAHMLMRSTELMNELKTKTDRGELALVMATTDAEYREFVEKDDAFKSRTFRISIPSPTAQEVVDALRVHRDRLEQHYGMRITEGALTAAARLTFRYYPNDGAYRKSLDILDRALGRVQSDKKFGSYSDLQLKDEKSRLEREQASLRRDLSDETDSETKQELSDRIHDNAQKLASIQSKLSAGSTESEITIRQQRIVDLEKQRTELNNAGKFQEAANLLSQKRILEGQLADLNALPNSNTAPDRITEKHIYSFVAADRGVPAGNLAKTDLLRAQQMNSRLNELVPGQDSATRALSESYKVQIAGVEKPSGPADVILLTGSSGNGKTEMTKAYTLVKFDSSKKIVSIEMNQLDHNSRMELTGSGPGLVNNEEGGKLEPIRRDGFQTLRLDELDKADRSIDNILMKILDEGEMEDARGRKIDFKNTSIIITANWGEEYAIDRHLYGDDIADRNAEKRYNWPNKFLEGKPKTEKDGLVIDAAMERAGVSLAFRNRIRTKILMNVLSPADALAITRIKLSEQADEVYRNHKITLRFDQSVAEALFKMSYDPRFGMRPFEAARRGNISPLIAEAVISETGVQRGETLDVHFVPDAENRGGQLQILRQGSVLHAKQVLFKSLTAPDFKAGRTAGELGKPAKSPLERVKAATRKARGK